MSRNPTVNRYLSDKAMDRIDHALGRPAFPLAESYRNYFNTDPNDERFVDNLHWRQFAPGYFAVTRSGREALAAYLIAEGQQPKVYEIALDYDGERFSRRVPAKSRSAAKYDYWLRVSDTSDVSFRDFLACIQSVRLVRGGNAVTWGCV
jgi:hypothetical protein